MEEMNRAEQRVRQAVALANELVAYASVPEHASMWCRVFDAAISLWVDDDIVS